MELAFYRGSGTLYDKLIRWWTGSQFSHVEIVLERREDSVTLFSSSPRDGGVRVKDCALDTAKWEFYVVPGEFPKGLMDYVGAKYDWLGIFGSQFFAAGWNLKRRWFCSEICGAAIGLDQPQRYSPEGLRQIVLIINAAK
jgi:hypothetical protein